MTSPRRKPSARPSDASASGPLRFAGYGRVSTGAQAEKEISIPAQLAACRNYGAGQGWTFAGEFDDPGVSGSTVERPGLQSCLSAARACDFDVLVVHKLDRLSRDPRDTLVLTAQLRQHGVRLVSVTENFVGGEGAMDEAMTGMAMTFNRLHVANVKAETRKGLRQIANPRNLPPVGPEYEFGPEHESPGETRAQLGRMGGPCPYGYRLAHPGVRASPWVMDEDRAPWVTQMYEWIAAGKMIADVCRLLHSAAAPPPIPSAGWTRRGRTGGLWVFQTVKQILTNRVYRGQVHSEGEWYPGAHVALIPYPLWSRVQQTLTSRAPGRVERCGALFAGGLLKCPKCRARGVESSLYALHTVTPGLYTYRCGLWSRQQGRQAAGETFDCPGFMISERKVLRLLHLYLEGKSAALSPFALADLDREQSEEWVPMPSAAQGRQMAALTKEQEALPALRARYQQMAARDLMTDDELAACLAGLAARRAEIEAALLALPPEAPPAQIKPREARQVLRMLEADDLTTLQKRDRLRMVFQHLVPSEDKTSLDIFLPSTSGTLD